MLKPAISSLEGQSTATVLASCIGALYYILSDDKSVTPDQITKLATSAQDVVTMLSAKPDVAVQVKELGKLGLVLAFMYKVLITFLNSRTELKKEELKLKLQQLNSSSSIEENK